MLSIARNPFNYTPRQINNAYKSKSFAPTLTTQYQLTNHLKSLKNCDAISRAVSIDIDSFSSPLSQNLIDIWHQSNLPWNEFRHSTQTLDNLWKEENGFQSNNTILNGYHAQFTRNIYAPLISQYVNKQQPYLLNGDSNLLLQQIIDVYDHFLTQRRRQLSPNHSLQIDIRSMNPLQISPYLDNDTEDEEDEDDYCQSMVPNNTKFKPCFISNHNKYNNNLVSKMRECIPRFTEDHQTLCYKRYEILLYGEEFQIFEANTNNEIPSNSYQHPLPKIYNAIEGFDTHQPGLLTFTFLVDHDCIRVYTMFADGTRQLYGTRIFKQDLLQTIPKLFVHHQLSTTTQALLDRLEFIPDPVYDEYYKYLGAAKTKSIDIEAAQEQKDEIHEIKKQEDVDSEAEYDPYEDHQLFDGLLDQQELHHDEALYLQQETNKYLMQQLEKSKNDLMYLSNEISRFEVEHEDYNIMDDIQINAFNEKEIESGLELPDGW